MNNTTIDRKILPLVRRINNQYNIETTNSCSGHAGKNTPYVALRMPITKAAYLEKVVNKASLSGRKSLSEKTDNGWIEGSLYFLPNMLVSMQEEKGVASVTMQSTMYFFKDNKSEQMADLERELFIDKVIWLLDEYSTSLSQKEHGLFQKASNPFLQEQ